MDIVYDLSGQNTPVVQPFLVFSEAADINQGALVEAPVTGDGPEERGAIDIINTLNGPVDVVGLLTQFFDTSVVGEWTYNGTLTTASNRPEADVDIRPLGVFRTELVEGSGTVYNTSDTTEIAITTDKTWDSDDLIGGGWLYDDATEQLRYIEDHNATTTFELNTATTTAITNAQNRAVVHVPPRLYGNDAGAGMTLNSTFDKMYLDGDETVLWARVLDVWVQPSKSAPLERLNPGIHDAILTSAAKLYMDFVVTDHFFNPFS